MFLFFSAECCWWIWRLKQPVHACCGKLLNSREGTYWQPNLWFSTRKCVSYFSCRWRRWLSVAWNGVWIDHIGSQCLVHGPGRPIKVVNCLVSKQIFRNLHSIAFYFQTWQNNEVTLSFGIVCNINLKCRRVMYAFCRENGNKKENMNNIFIATFTDKNIKSMYLWIWIFPSYYME